MLQMILLQIESGTIPPDIIKIGQHLTLLLLKEKGCQFLIHSVYSVSQEAADSKYSAKVFINSFADEISIQCVIQSLGHMCPRCVLWAAVTSMTEPT